MDEINVRSSWTNRLLSALISKGLEKYFGSEIQVDVSELNAQVTPDTQDLKVHINANVTIGKRGLERLVWKT